MATLCQDSTRTIVNLAGVFKVYQTQFSAGLSETGSVVNIDIFLT